MQELGGGTLCWTQFLVLGDNFRTSARMRLAPQGPIYYCPALPPPGGRFRPHLLEVSAVTCVCMRVSETEIEKQTENSLPRPCPSRVTKHCRDLPPPLPSSH